MKWLLKKSEATTISEIQSVTIEKVPSRLGTGSEPSSLHDDDGECEKRGGNGGVLSSDGLAGRTEYPSMWKTVTIVLGLFMGAFLVALDQTIIGTAIPKITDEFETIQVRSRLPRGHHGSGSRSTAARGCRCRKAAFSNRLRIVLGCRLVRERLFSDQHRCVYLYDSAWLVARSTHTSRVANGIPNGPWLTACSYG